MAAKMKLYKLYKVCGVIDFYSILCTPIIARDEKAAKLEFRKYVRASRPTKKVTDVTVYEMPNEKEGKIFI